MKKMIIVFLCIVLAVSLVIAGRLVYPYFHKNDASQWEEQYNLGVHYLREERYADAIAAFKTAMDMDPSRYEAYVAQGDACMRLGQYEAAQQLYQKARHLEPEDLNMVIQRLEKAQSAIEEQNQPETTVSETVPVGAPEEKKISVVMSLYNGDVSTEEVFHYDDNGKLTQRVTTGYIDGQQAYTYALEYLYDGAGNLLSRKEAGSPFVEYEYHYDNGTLTGYTYNEIIGDFVATSTTFHYAYDGSGNVIRITTTGTAADVWTNGKYTYDAEGRCLSAYEHERYGDHEFKRDIAYDYTNKGAIIATEQQSLFGSSETIRTIQFGNMKYGFIQGAHLYDGYSIVTDTDGYLIGVKDGNGQLVNTFEYVTVSSVKNTDAAAN